MFIVFLKNCVDMLQNKMDNSKKIICPYCTQCFKKQKYLNAHLKNIHPQDEDIQKTMFACNYCSSFFKTYRRLQVHRSQHHKDENLAHRKEQNTFTCYYCGKNFRRKKRLLVHIQNIHMPLTDQQKTRFSCNLCNSHFKNELWLGRHIVERHVKIKGNHENENVACVDTCDDVFKHLKAMDMQNDILSQALEATDVTLIPEIDIENLKISSLGDKTFYHCDFCNKSYPKLSLLKRHITIHGNQKPYKCSLCNVKFRYTSSLRLHAKEQHNLKCSNNRKDIFLKEFEKYVNKMKSNPIPCKLKKENNKRKKRNDSNVSNEIVVQNQTLSMPTLNILTENDFITKGWPITNNTSDPKVQTQVTKSSSALENRRLSDTVSENLSSKELTHVNKTNSKEPISLFYDKFLKNINIIDQSCATDENFSHNSMFEPIQEILDNEISLDTSLGDLPGNCSFENISLSEIDVQRIDTDDSMIEQNLQKEDVIRNCLNEDVNDNISNIEQSAVNDTGNNIYVDIGYIKPFGEISICGNYESDDAHSTNIPNDYYMLNDEVYIDQLVTTKNIDAVDDHQKVIISQTTQRSSQYICPLNKMKTFPEDDEDDIEDILKSLNVKIVSDTSENEVLDNIEHIIIHKNKTNEILDNVHVDHTYVKLTNLQNVNCDLSELVSPNTYLNEPQNINNCLTKFDVINENETNISVSTGDGISDILPNNYRSNKCQSEDFHETQELVIGPDMTQNKKKTQSHLSSDTHTFKENQNKSGFSSEMTALNNNTRAVFNDEMVLQINNSTNISDNQIQTFLLNFEKSQNNVKQFKTSHTLNEETLLQKNAMTTNDERISPINNNASISDNDMESLLLDFDFTLDGKETSTSQSSMKNLLHLNNDPPTSNNEFLLQTTTLKNGNQVYLNNFKVTQNNKTILKSKDLLKVPGVTDKIMPICADDKILQTNNGVLTSESNIQSSLTDFDRVHNSHTILKYPTNQIVPTENEAITETNNDKCIPNNQNHDFLVNFNEATPNSLHLLRDYNVINHNVSSCNDINSDTARVQESLFNSLINEDRSIYGDKKTLGNNVEAPALDTTTQMPSVDFDVAQTSQEILQSLLSDQPLPSISPSAILKKEHTIDTLGNGDEEKIILKLLSTRNLKYMMQSDEARFTCDVCPAKFTRKNRFLEHKKIHELTDLWICDTCMKVFSCRKSIMVHMKYHGTKRIPCKVCGELRHPLSMKNHMRKHNNDTPYSCPLCKKLFKNTSTKNYHMEFEHKKELKGSKSSLVNLISDVMDSEATTNKTDINIPFILPSLNQASNNKKKRAMSSNTPKLGTIKKQKAKTNDDTYYACECGILFKYKGSLMLHKHKCNNQPHEYQFSCNVCNEVFSSKSWLTRHRRTARHKYNENKTKET